MAVRRRPVDGPVQLWETSKMKLSGFLLIFVLHYAASQSTYQVGIGIADVTGPAAEINMVRTSVKGPHESRIFNDFVSAVKI